MNKIFIKTKPYKERMFDSCGPASLKIVLAFYGVKKTEKELMVLCKVKSGSGLGTSAKNIKNAAEKLGFKAKIKEKSSFKDIEYWLKKNVPVIVDWFTRGGDKCAIADGHYSVVAGLDDKFIYLQDPEIGKMRKMKKDDFMKVWFDFKGMYIKQNELVIRETIVIYK